MVRAIVCDLDGTLLASIGTTEIYLFEAAAQMRLPTDDARLSRLREYVRIELKNNFTEIFSELWPGANIEALRTLWQTVEKQRGFPLTKGVKFTLHELDAMGISLHVLTSRGESTSHFLIDHGIDGYFSSVHSLFDQPFNKPDPRCANALLAELTEKDIERHEILIVGDTYHLDGKLARALGIPFVGITAGMHTREQFRETGLPDEMIIDSLLEVLDHI